MIFSAAMLVALIMAISLRFIGGQHKAKPEPV